MQTVARAALLCVTLSALCAAAPAQEKQTPPQPSGLAVEISISGYAPGYQSVPGESFGGRYREIPGAPPPAGVSEPLLIRVQDRMEGDAVRVVVSAYADKFHEREIAIASFLLRENERVTVNEMRNVGFEPFGLAVVRVKPDAPPPPTATSKIPSVGVVGVEAAKTNFPSFKVTLRNLSQKDIVYLEIRNLAENGRTLTIQWPRGEQNRPVLPAGSTYEARSSGGGGGARSSDGYAPDTPRFVEVVAAVFSDHTYEGDAGSAATHLARVSGQKSQLARALALLREASAGATAEQLKTRAAALGRALDEAGRAELGARFPEFDAARLDGLKASYEYGLDLVRKELLKDIQEYEAGGGKPFGPWLAELTRKYEAWLSRV